MLMIKFYIWKPLFCDIRTLVSGYIAWHGRYCANSYKDFSGFMKRTFDEVSGGMLNNDITDDTQIDPEIFGR